MSAVRRIAAAVLGTATAVAGLQVLTPDAAHAAVNHLVINEVYGGGGNTGAPYTYDFVEIYNPTSGPLSLSG